LLPHILLSPLSAQSCSACSENQRVTNFCTPGGRDHFSHRAFCNGSTDPPVSVVRQTCASSGHGDYKLDSGIAVGIVIIAVAPAALLVDAADRYRDAGKWSCNALVLRCGCGVHRSRMKMNHRRQQASRTAVEILDVT
jgi:hypothetical protein